MRWGWFDGSSPRWEWSIRKTSRLASLKPRGYIITYVVDLDGESGESSCTVSDEHESRVEAASSRAAR